MKRILAALDGSPRAGTVLDAAVDLARRTGSTLSLYRAVGLPSELPAVALSMSPTEIAAMLERLAADELARIAERVPPAMLAGTRVSTAIPWQGICEAARLAEADLIVIGSHGYGGLDRVLGTTAARIVNHAEVSVLVVKGKGWAASPAHP